MLTPRSDGPRDLPLDDRRRETGTPPRTIRFHRQRGLVAAARRRRRRANHDPAQIERLRTIADVCAGGLGLGAVAKVVSDPSGESAALTGHEIELALDDFVSHGGSLR